MRLFVGLDLEFEVRMRVASFIGEVRELAPDAAWVLPESLHITLKFIGERTSGQLKAITERLSAIDVTRFSIQLDGHGYFPTARAPRVFWIGVQASPRLADLAGRIECAMVELGISPEVRPFNPHLTLARANKRGLLARGEGKRRKPQFKTLEEKLARLVELDFGTVTISEFILYRSELSPLGSKYTRLHRFGAKIASG